MYQLRLPCLAHLSCGQEVIARVALCQQPDLHLTALLAGVSNLGAATPASLHCARQTAG